MTDFNKLSKKYIGFIERSGISDKNTRISNNGSKKPPLKMKCSTVFVEQAGVLRYDGLFDSNNIVYDYNHYRTVNKKLNGTNDRAISLVTTKIYDNLKKIVPDVQYGDMGENFTLCFDNNLILKDGLMFQFGNDTILQLTAPTIPCFRLSYVPWAEKMGGKTWWKTGPISDFGGRGWYAKVITEGNVVSGDNIYLFE